MKLNKVQHQDIDECPAEYYDLIVIGAGPAGLFCAINSSIDARKILVLEKKDSPGRKLLVSGSGHCNLTHDGDIEKFLDHYGDHSRFIRPALLGFTNQDLITFFEDRGLSMIREAGGKVFPRTMRSRDVLDALLKECSDKKVNLKHGIVVKSVSYQGRGFEVVSRDKVYRSGVLVIATGGCSYPATGSTGDGYNFAISMGHRIAEVGPALTPAYIKDYPFSGLSGVSFQDMKVSLHRNCKVKDRFGDVLLTHQGLSGPGILDISRDIRAGDIIKLSFAGKRGKAHLDDWLLEKARENGARGIKAVLSDLALPERLIPIILESSSVPEGTKCAHLTREMRSKLLDNLTAFPLKVERLGGYEEAMVTRGGIELKEVNPKTMESRLVKGLYMAGEVLDVDGDTGGYNLQAAFSTGALAARSIAQGWNNP
jgi:predicted Rossmann fold flavoprotein